MKPALTLSSGARRVTAALAALALSATVAACGSSASKKSTSGAGRSGAKSGSSAAATTATTATVANASAKGGPTLVVGDQAGTGAQALLQASGLLHKLPFPVKFADFSSGPPILQAMSGGSVDVAGVGNAPVVFAAAGRDKIAIVGARRNNVKASALVVPKGSSISSIKDLKGKKIAVAQGSSADYHLLTVLSKAGLTPHDVQLVYLQPAQALAAVSSGSVDAWDTWSPFTEQAVAQKGAKVLVDGDGYGANYAYEVASKSAISDPAKAKEITAYLKAVDNAYRWTNTHPAAWAKTWAAATGLPQSITLQAAKHDTTIPVPVNAQTTTTSEQGLVNAFASAGLIPNKFDFSSFSTPKFNSSVG